MAGEEEYGLPQRHPRPKGRYDESGQRGRHLAKSVCANNGQEVDANIASKCGSANIVRDHATILPNDATPKPDGIFGKDTKGMIPFRRLRWCSTCVIVGSTPAVDV
jgi:hypothetical protein